MNELTAVVSLSSIAGNGFLCSAATTFSYAQGPLVGALGTVAVSSIAIVGSGACTLALASAIQDSSFFLEENHVLTAGILLVTFVALHALTLSAAIWALPIAPLSFQATVLSGLAVFSPLAGIVITLPIVMAIVASLAPQRFVEDIPPQEDV